MKNKEGFIELNNVQDYCKKLVYDYETFKSDETNIYKAFNFFITAYHLYDWIKFSDLINESELGDISDAIILKVCDEIASGAKHYKLTYKRHNSIKEIYKDRWVEDGWVEDGYFYNPIIINLDNEAEEYYGNQITALDFARKILEFWNEKLNKFNIQTVLNELVI